MAQPPDSAHGQPLLCSPDMTVGDLKTYEIHLIRKDSKPPQQQPKQVKRADSTAGSEEPSTEQVEEGERGKRGREGGREYTQTKTRIKVDFVFSFLCVRAANAPAS